jgi:hypothetical protein
MEDAERDLAGRNFLLDDKQEMLVIGSSESNSVGDVDGEAQIDPRCFAPLPIRRNASTQGLKTSLLFVLFEYCLKEGILSLVFSDDLSTIWKLDKFANASFHSGFQTSVSKWREKISEDTTLRDRLIKQHKSELISLTYPLTKRSGAKPKRKRGYNDKGSTRPLHQRHRSGKEVCGAEYLADLAAVEKVVNFGRRPTVTYRRLPYSREIGRLIEEGLLTIEGEFILPS